VFLEYSKHIATKKYFETILISKLLCPHVVLLCSVYIIVMFMYRNSFLGSFAKTLQKRIATTSASSAVSRDDQEDNEFDIKKV